MIASPPFWKWFFFAGLVFVSGALADVAVPQGTGAVTLVTFGDSTTAVRGSTKVYPAILQEELRSVRVINAGVGGNTTDLAKKRFEQDVLSHAPQIAVIQFGINDSAVDVWKTPPAAAPRVPLERYEANLRYFIQTLKGGNTSVVLMTPNPLRWTARLKETYGRPPYDPLNPDGFNAQLAPYCEAVRRVARDEGAELVDIQQVFVEEARKRGVGVEAFLSDGMHPNDEGHRIEARILMERILVLAKKRCLPVAAVPGMGSDADAPIVGAIRWDAWYGTGGVVQAVERSLGQPKYHFRLPWFARLLGGDRVSINGDSPGIMEREIAYAARAGLNYWAFLNYWQDSSDLGIGLKRYLAASDKKGVRYCLLEEGGRLDRIGAKAWGSLVQHFRSPDYQKVLGGRPLLFVYIKPRSLTRADWDELRRQTVAAGLMTPYLVLMGWDLGQDLKDMAELGFDALSAYARGGAYSMEQPSYEEQGRLLKQRLWDEWESRGIPCITLASAGWDTRPRNERPPEWIKDLKVQPAPAPVPLEQQRPLVDSVTGTPGEVASHLFEAVRWTRTHRDINPANAVIVYAWNEHDEGGWLQPTLGPDGSPDEGRIQALEKVLRLSAADPGR